jgi:hypothetical protein
MSHSYPSTQQQQDPFPQQPQKKGFWKRFAELGPAWISALVAVIGLLTAGAVYVVVVHVGASSTPTATAPPSPAVSRGGPTAGPSPTGDTGTAGNGTQLAPSYLFQLTNSYSAPLGLTKPTQAQIGRGVASYDIFYYDAFQPGPGEKMLSLPNGSTPTYTACATDTVFVGSASATPGTAFCIVETTGRVAGVTVTSINGSPNYAVLKVTLWQDVQ